MTEETKNYLNMDRFCGFQPQMSVDDGKSTLIGRLFHDTKAIFEDQLEAIEKTSKQGVTKTSIWLLLTDGLPGGTRAGDYNRCCLQVLCYPSEEIHYCGYSGHIQYTRNMVTGASRRQTLRLILIDARNGVVEQTREGMHSSPTYLA